jgi:optic atrophy 3 protein
MQQPSKFLDLNTNIPQNAIKRNAHEHERFRRICVKFAQGLHRIDMRMRLGLLQDPAVIDRQIKKEVALAEAARKKAQAPTVLTEAEMKAEEAMSEKEKEAIRKKAEERSKPRIRPLSEQKAIETGANFVAETFIFAVGIGVIVFEQWRQRRKAKNARDDIREDLDELQTELKSVKAELEEWKAKHIEPAPSKLMGLWKGGVKTPPAKPTADIKESTKPTEVPTSASSGNQQPTQDQTNHDAENEGHHSKEQ